MANYGKQVITMLSDGQALPNATAGDSTSMAFIGRRTGGGLVLSVYAKTALAVATGQAFSIELQGFTADTAASATSPFSTSNDGTQGSGTLEDNAHYYLIHKTSADGALDVSAGAMITQIVLPGELLDQLNYDWIQLVYSTDENLSAQTVDAILTPLF